MTLLNISLSMPMTSDSTYKPVWAKTIGSNKAYLEKLLSSTSLKPIATTTKGEIKHTVFQVHINDYEDFYFVHGEDSQGRDLIHYGVRAKTFNCHGLLNIKTIGQVSVWRNAKYGFLFSGFAAWVFKNILFPINGNIVSDNAQSTKGKDFWYSRIQEELEIGTKIYALGVEQIKPHSYEIEEIQAITSIKQVEQYYSYAPDTTGSFYRIIMTKKPLEKA